MNSMNAFISYIQKTLEERSISPKKYFFNLPFYKTKHHLLQTKRFLLQNIMIFFFQFLIINAMHFSNINFPLYPPIGVAFTMFYLLGNSVFFGLLIAGLIAYFLKGFPINALFLYLTADILASFLCMKLSLATFSSDIRPFAKLNEVLHFVKNIFIASLLSSLLRLMAYFLFQQSKLTDSNITFSFIEPFFMQWLNYWLADVNALFIIPAFLLSWAFVPFSREKCFPKNFPKKTAIVVLFFIVISVLFMKYFALIYLIIFAMMASLILAKYYGYLISTFLLFILSCLYLTYFMLHANSYFHHFGSIYSIIAALFLFVWSLSLIYFSHQSNFLITKQ